MTSLSSLPPAAQEPSSATRLARNPKNLRDNRRVERLRGDGDQDGAEEILGRQREALAIDRVVGNLSGDPLWRSQDSTGLHPDVEIDAWITKKAHDDDALERIYQEEGINEVQSLRRKMVEAYRERQQAPATGDPAEQQPIEWDPNELADARMRLSRMHERGRREVNPEFNLYEDPVMGPLALSMNEGNVAVSGEQQLELGLIGGAANLAMQPLRGVWDLGFGFGYGAAALGNRLLQGLSGGSLGFAVQPTHAVVDDDGRVWTNQGKVTLDQALLATWESLVDGQVSQDAINLGKDQELLEAQRHGLGRVTSSAAYLIGTLAGFGITGGPIIGMTRGGLRWLASMGRVAEHSGRAAKLIDLAALSVGTAGYEAVLSGEIEGYGKAAAHGLLMGPLFWGLGLLGRRTEAFLSQTKVPAAFARPIAGAMEGIGFTVAQPALGTFFSGDQALWDLIKDPTKERWSLFAEEMAINMIAMGALKTISPTPGERLLEPEQMETKLPAAPERQVEAARELQEAEAAAKEVAAASPRLREPAVERYTVEGREGRVLPVVEHKGTLPGGHAEALEKGLPSKYIEEREISHEEATRKQQERRRAGQRGRDPLEDPGFREFPEDVKKSILEAKDVSERRRIWQQEAPRVIAEAVDRLKADVEREGIKDEHRQRLRDLIQQANMTSAERELPPFAAKLTERLSPERLTELGQRLRAVEMTRERPELRQMAQETALKARQELAAEVRGPESPERVLARREQLHERLKSQAGEEETFAAPRDPLKEDLANEIAENPDISRLIDLTRRVRQAEKNDLPLEEVKKLMVETGWPENWERFSRARGYTEQEIADFRELHDLSRRFPQESSDIGYYVSQELQGLRWNPKKRSWELVEEPTGEEGDVASPLPPFIAAAHSGSFPAARGIEPKEGAELTRASDVFRRMQGVHEQHPIKFAIRWRRSGHWAKGWYSSQEKLTRVGVPLDLNTGAHEFAHAMQDQTIGLRWKPKDKAVRAEMQDLGRALYGPTAFNRLPVHRQVAEGWAEFWARDLLGDTTLDKQFPNASRFLRAWLAAPAQDAVREQYESVAEGMRNYRDQGALGRRRASIHFAGDKLSPEQEAVLGSKKDQIKRFLDLATDDMARARHAMQRYGIETGDVPMKADPHRMLSLWRGRGRSIADTFINRATLGRGMKRSGEGLKPAFDELTLEDRIPWAMYVASRVELERQDRGMAGSLSREENLAVIEKLHDPRYERTAKRVKGVFDRAVDYMVYHGAISEGAADTIKESYAYYIPLFKMLEGPRLAGRPSRGVAEAGPAVGRAKGSEHELRDPYEAITQQLYTMVTKAHQASVMKSLRTLSLIEPGLGGLMSEVPRDVRPIVLNVSELRKALEKLGVHTKAEDSDVDLASILTLFEPVQRPTGHEAIIEYSPNYTEHDLRWLRENYGDKIANKAEKENGKAKWWELDNDMFESLMGLDAENALYAPRVVIAATRLVKLGRVALSPAFTLNNILRDAAELPMFGSSELQTRWVPIVGGLVEMGLGAKTQLKGRNPIAGIKRLMGKQVPIDPVMQIFLDAGGKGSTYLAEATQPRKISYENLFRRNLKQRVAATIEHPLRSGLRAIELIERGMSEAELPGRVREMKLTYDRAIKEGKGEDEAAFEGLEAAAEVTQNYIRNGAIIRGASRWYAFLGARIGGVRRMTRAMLGYEGRDRQMRVITGGISTMSTLAVLNYFLNGDREDWQDRPDWLRNNYITWYLGEYEITWPKSHEVSKVLYNPIEWAIGAFYGTNKDDAASYWLNMVINELRDYAFIPTIFQPAAETISNYNFFTGKPIVPPWMEERLSPEKRSYIYTTWIARQIGKVLNVSPIKVEHAMGQYTGGMSLSLMRTIDDMFDLKEAAATRQPESDQEQLAELPFIGTLFRHEAHSQSATVDELFEAERAVRQSDDPRLQAMRSTLRQAREQVSAILKEAREGRRSRVEADRMAYRAALPAVRQYRRLTSGR